MILDFKNNIQKLDLFKKSSKLLVAVSGGVDSTVMLDLLYKCGYNCVVAHCNFLLRGKESDSEELFVKRLAENYKFLFLSKKFETKNYAIEQGISIQMAARELRYKWFEKLRDEENCQHIAVAHNRNDTIETFFINIIRGTGINGLTGIDSKNGFVVRPLLFASREMIVSYALQNNLSFMHDSSNDETKYTRNKIRLQILPLLKEINPGIENTMMENIERLVSVKKVYYEEINKGIQEFVSRKDGKICLNISLLKNIPEKKTYLFEFLRNYNFTQHHIDDIFQMLESTSGKYIESDTHVLLKDRTNLILSEKVQIADTVFEINSDTKKILIPVPLTFEKLQIPSNYKPDKEKNTACLDFDKLGFPLSIRKWRRGDVFYPFGMTTKKKLSDFFSNEKFTLFDKQNTWLLTSENMIVWIIGYRIDNRYSITESTKQILKIVVE